MKFHKYHGLGNDYIVIDPAEWSRPLDAALIQRICDRHRGVGSDGILYGPVMEESAFVLRIYNPDASIAEKSGNGIRIFSRYLWDTKRVGREPFEIRTLGGAVRSVVLDNGAMVRADMGRVSFDASRIPVAGVEGEALNLPLTAGGRTLTVCAATVGNPHCVVLCDPEPISSELAHTLGPLVERHPRFPTRTNVQFLNVVDDSHIAIEIWERGAGYTLASGTSSIAASAVAHRLGRCGNHIEVSMPGGKLQVELSPDYDATLLGPVSAICDGELRPEMFDA